MKPVKLKDIAEKAGVGIGTASRVINNQPHVSKEKRERVLNVIEEMGYRPNSVARSLKTKSTKCIGVIIMDITNPFYSKVLKGLEDYSSKNSYSIIISNLNNNDKDLYKSINNLADRKVEGFIFLGSSINDKQAKMFVDKNIPTVCISTAIAIANKSLLEQFGVVSIDNEKASYDAVKHLIDKGHRDIAIISGLIGELNSSIPRERGYIRALKESGIEIYHSWITHGTFSFESGYECMISLLKLDKRPTAIYAISDLMAMGATKALFENGYKVPEDIAVMGFDGIENAKYFHPSISTIKQPRYDMGFNGMKLLLDMINNVKNIDLNIHMDHNLIIREST